MYCSMATFSFSTRLLLVSYRTKHNLSKKRSKRIFFSKWVTQLKWYWHLNNLFVLFWFGLLSHSSLLFSSVCVQEFYQLNEAMDWLRYHRNALSLLYFVRYVFECVRMRIGQFQNILLTLPISTEESHKTWQVFALQSLETMAMWFCVQVCMMNSNSQIDTGKRKMIKCEM